MIRLLVVMLAGMLAVGEERQPGQGVNLYSKEKEAALGAELAAEVRHANTVLESATVRDYVARLTRQLAAQLPQDGVTYTSEVITGQTNVLHEPISLPGGYIFVHAGLFFAARDEAEFAGMLAHAMAHVAERHGTRMGTRDQPAKSGRIPVIFMGGSQGMVATGGALPLSLLPFARAFELEADLVAARTMARAGYDPAALARYIQHTQIDLPGRPPALSPLPPRDTRVANLEEAIGKLPARTYSSSPEYERVRDEVCALTGKRTPSPPSLR